MIWGGGSAGRSGGKGNWSGCNICKKKRDIMIQDIQRIQ